MPYGTLGLLITLGLCDAFLLSDQPTTRAKILLAPLIAIAFWLTYRMPDWQVLGLLFQLGLSIGILLYFKYHKVI